MRSLYLAAGLLACACAGAAELDGKTFHGEIVNEKGEVRTPDVVSFRQGKFHSVTCERFGFGAMPYWVRTEGDTIHFLAESAHPDNGSMRFKGTIRAGRAEWKAVWTKERWYWSIRREIAFSGTEKK